MINRLIAKAAKSTCNHKVAAIGFNKKNEIVGVCFNSRRYNGLGRSHHAEMTLMRRYGKRISQIYICRVNKHEKLLPIHPCTMCSEKAKELGIKIVSTRLK